MLQKGFVYIMTNQSMPNKLKVGKTLKVPTERAKELGTTGVPTSFEVQYYAFFDDMDEAEKRAHRNLSNFHHGKEFYDVDIPAAIYAIETTGIPFQKLFSKPENDRKAAALHEKMQTENNMRDEARRQRKEMESKLKEEIEKKQKEDLIIKDIYNQEQIQKTIKYNNTYTKTWSIVMMAGLLMVLLATNIFTKGALFMLLFYPGIISCLVGIVGLFHEFQIKHLLSRCPKCQGSNSVFKISDHPNEKYQCTKCQACFDYSEKK